MKKKNEKIRNIAIIAHVDHGKTTLVDQMFKQSGLIKSHQNLEERIMDNMDLEKERGITIAAKNCSIYWRGTKINILDTPGHADFGGEVERALLMVDGVILLVDASEGPLPQTRFVLQKTLEKRLKIICVINKIDREDARISDVLNEVYDLFIDLGATDEQIDFPVFFAVGRDGIVKESLTSESNGLIPLFEGILDHIPPPEYLKSEPFQMLVADLDYSDFVGQLAIGRIAHGQVRCNDSLVRIDTKGNYFPLKAVKIQEYQGLEMKEVPVVEAGNILVLAGIQEVEIGDTICMEKFPKKLPRIKIDPPIISMRFMANTSPLSGSEGKIVQSTKIRDRLYKETLRNVALEMEETGDHESYILKGRGEFQMAILIEMMRREGFELNVGRPEVILKHKGKKCLEPFEKVVIDCENCYLGIVNEKISKRKGKMEDMRHHAHNRIRLSYNIPSRGLIGYRNEFLTDTRGTGLLSSYFLGYEPFKGDMMTRIKGSMVSDREGKSVAYSLFRLEPRGCLFIKPGEKVYNGMVVGEHNRESDLLVNVCREKKLTNIRAAGSDEAVTLTSVVPLTVERALDFIKEDETVEFTPLSIRIRKITFPKK